MNIRFLVFFVLLITACASNSVPSKPAAAPLPGKTGDAASMTADKDEAPAVEMYSDGKTRMKKTSAKLSEKEGKFMVAPPEPKDRAVMNASAVDSAPKAGEHDDNEEFQYFLKFMNDSIGNKAVDELLLENRNLLAICDSNGRPVFHALVKSDAGEELTCADGEVMIPGKFMSQSTVVSISYGGMITNVKLVKDAVHRQLVKLTAERKGLQNIPVDIVFLMDTTGSMGDEIDILKNTVYSIYKRINDIPSKSISARYGMVLYRDAGDDYVTQDFPLTSNIEDFQKFLFEAEASGGGDEPEDMISGLSDVLYKMNWKSDSIKLVFLVTDAPAHAGSLADFDKITKDSRANAVKIFSIGASGLSPEGEIHLRLLSQQTKGRFIFLTYGETGESSGAGTADDPGKVSHHTGANYASRNLDDIVVDNVKAEIYHQMSDKELFALRKAYDYKADEDKVFRRVDNALQQIKKQLEADKKLSDKSTVLVLPPDAEDKTLDALARHVGSLAEDIITKEKMLQVIDRTKMKVLTEEIKLKLAGMTGGSIKEMAGADSILSGRLYYIGNSTVLFVRLIDAGTTEVVAASMVKI